MPTLSGPLTSLACQTCLSNPLMPPCSAFGPSLVASLQVRAVEREGALGDAIGVAPGDAAEVRAAVSDSRRAWRSRARRCPTCRRGRAPRWRGRPRHRSGSARSSCARWRACRLPPGSRRAWFPNGFLSIVPAHMAASSASVTGPSEPSSRPRALSTCIPPVDWLVDADRYAWYRYHFALAGTIMGRPASF